MCTNDYSNTEFSKEEVEKCVQAMSRTACIEALELIASGFVIIELTSDRRDVYIDRLHGVEVRDPDNPCRKMLMSGAWPLFRAGMINQFGTVTPAGMKLLKERKCMRS
ncbi:MULTISPECIES: hypothetical protein [Acetobacter]|uniref:Uncharacterized protein n=2 Tax=Acetobacter TaxID=434 RepID=A0A401WXA5_ACEPA|nr:MULTISPECIES: hypothetical protein [Acetobacter]PHY94166.1 hypothetical protein CSR02_07665 [Acetobacter pomorum]QHM90079.1 hypothetical protein FCN51_00310 [Acetobacter pasteurianus]GBR54331.1 hypothetical protein AA11825_2650 [Acetobacter pomorum DSM 11825]GCD53946.1 hypothetical protein NBRC3188_2643 [Acetobacter pasteurianus NBRC 3188]